MFRKFALVTSANEIFKVGLVTAVHFNNFQNLNNGETFSKRVLGVYFQ